MQGLATMAEDGSRQRLPEERQFRAVLWTACLVALLFLYLFVMLTVDKAKLSPNDISSNWFVAWGSWAGGLMTGAAFLIAAYSIVVSSAYSRQDRREAAAVQAAKDIAQARLLTIYKVDVPDQLSMRFYRIDNRSSERFFDVSVAQAVRFTLGVEDARLTPESITDTWQVLPENELLTPYRTQEHDASWFTEVRIYATSDQDVQFAVSYTDASGNNWKQHLSGRIERIITAQAISKPRKADFVQPYSELRTLTEQEAEEMGLGGTLRRRLTGEDDTLLSDTEIELRSAQLVDWTRVARMGTPRAQAISADTITLEIPYGPRPPLSHPWGRYFRDEMAKIGFSENMLRFRGQGGVEEVRLEVPLAQLEGTIENVTTAIVSANDQFERREYKRACEAMKLRAQIEDAAAAFQRDLDERTASFTAPGEVPWHQGSPTVSDPLPDDEGDGPDGADGAAPPPAP